MNETRRGAAENMPTPEQLAARQLRLLRQGRRWSQLEVAEKMRAYGYRWSQATVTRLESASRPIRLNELADLATLYGVRVAQFLESGTPDDIETLEAEIRNLSAEREELRVRLAHADLAAERAETDGAEIRARLARIEGRLEALARWHPSSSF